MITASVIVKRASGGEPIEREFDGGILQILSRSGSGKLYLLETKGGATSAKSANVLARKLQALGLPEDVTRLAGRSAFATIEL